MATTRKQRAQAHAKHGFFCTCGRIVHGNGGKAQHKYMHEQAGDGHRYMTSAGFQARFPGVYSLPWPERGARKVEGPYVEGVVPLGDSHLSE